MNRYLQALLIVWFILPSAYAKSKVNNTAIVQTEQGTFAGVDKGTYTVFRGIPYATPPVGHLRWRAPLPPEKHQGIYHADEFQSASIQASLITLGDQTKVTGSEDSLYLNIWVPKNQSKRNLPVMFWIHGGAFIIGAGNQGGERINMYDGAALAEKGEVIVVTSNYRLGPMGFLAHEELIEESEERTTGNYGILDQIAALKWVQKNIKNFGGDPDKVTIFGESAGGSSVLVLLASPLAKGLFSAAICQSGPTFDFDLKQHAKIGRHFAETYGITAKGKEIENLRNIEGEDIVRDFQMELNALDDKPIIKYGPVVDGYVLKYPILETILRGEHNKVPVIIGSNRNEMTVLSPLFLSEFKHAMSDEQYKFMLMNLLNHDEEVVAAAMRMYNRENLGSNKMALSTLMGDTMFHAPARLIARALEMQSPGSVYSYLFSHRVGLLQAGHGLDIPYVFGQEKLLMPLTWPVLLPAYAPFKMKSEKRFSNLLLKYWTRFAHTHNPNGVKPTKIPYWPTFGSGRIMELQTEPKVITSFRDTMINFWARQLMPKMSSKRISCKKLLE